MKKTTATDIAKICGVSQATVSYVINNKQGKKISEDVKNLILETAKQMNYHPDKTARNMRLHKAMSLGLVMGSNSVNLTFNTILKGIKRCADQQGYTITLLTDGEHDGENGIQLANQFISYFGSNTIDGIIFMFYEMNDDILKLLETNDIPYVRVSETEVSGKNLSIKTGMDVVIDRCILYCKERQLERISYLLFDRKAHNSAVLYKHSFFQQRVKELYPQARFNTFYTAFCDSDEQIKLWIDQMLQTTDVFITSSPRLTFLAQGMIMQKSMTVPQSIKLISLNHSKMLDMVYPTITHLDVPLVQMGEYATTYLLNQIQGKQTEAVPFLCTLKQGMSTL